MSKPMTPAQLYALLFGVTLLAVGILGFIADASFGAGTDVEGDDFIIFEVNGWHNLVHIASGALLIAAAPNGPLAATAATAFGLVYAVVTGWGFVDGNSVFALLPVDTADNFLHLFLTAAALFVGLTSGGLMASSRRTPRRAPGAPGRAGA
jgi:hypothetical protein